MARFMLIYVCRNRARTTDTKESETKMTTTYNIRAAADLTDAIEKEVAASGNTVIKFKNKEKKNYFFAAPQVTAGFVQAFAADAKGMEVLQDYVESLVKEIAKKKFNAALHFSAADCTIQNLVEYAFAASDNVKLTKDNIVSAFDAGWANTIAYALVLERDAAGAVVLCGDDVDAKQAYWNSEAGAKFLDIAGNYKAYLVRGAERKPTFETEAIKTKVMNAIANLDQEEQLVQKLVEKLQDAPIAAVEEDAL